MKKLLTIVMGIMINTVFGQLIELEWKIGKNEKIQYLTVMSEIDTTEMEINFGDFYTSFSDTSGKRLSEAKNFFKTINQSLQNVDYVSTMSNNGNGIIEIVISTRPKGQKYEITKDSIPIKENEALRMMMLMNQGVMLRGSVYANGGIHSFWVKNSQKNLIATLFELPSKPVKIGDTWNIDVNLIANDQNFSCDSAFKINEVSLKEIKKVLGETVAVIKYNITEYVSGTFVSPGIMGGGMEQKTTMKFTHQAIAEFSVDKGRWISYDGIMSFDAAGAMNSKKRTKFALVFE